MINPNGHKQMIIHELFAYLCVSDAAAAIDFYARAFGATEKFRLLEPGGRIGHAEVVVGEATLMLCEAHPEFGVESPNLDAPASYTIHLHVDNADDVIACAVQAGATVIRNAKDEFYGERSGVIQDPFGHRWMIGHSIEDVSPDEMQRRFTKLYAKQ